MSHISLTPTTLKRETSDAINIIIIQTIQHVQLNSYPFFFSFFLFYFSLFFSPCTVWSHYT